MARVIDVNVDTYTVSVNTEFSRKPQIGISFAVPYTHPNNGEGIYFMPEVGSICWICFPSEGNRAFVLGWAGAQREADFRAHRQELNPGDIYLGTRDENFMVLRRGGVVQIGATPLAQRIFIPVNNAIKDFCENYGLYTLGGELEWAIGRPEETASRADNGLTDGHRPAALTLRAREFSDDNVPVAELKIGSHGDSDPSILTLSIFDKGKTGNTAQFKLKFGKDGKATWDFKKQMTWKIHDKFSLTVDDDIEATTTKNMLLKSKSSQFQADIDMLLDAKSALNLKSPTVSVIGNLTVGGGGQGVGAVAGGKVTPVVLATDTLLNWLAGHVHTCSSPGSPSGPPTPTLTPSDVSSKKMAGN